jgi:hypothetical protein
MMFWADEIQYLRYTTSGILQVSSPFPRFSTILNIYRRTECTYCKTPLPSLLFSRSPSTPFPSDHHIQPSPANKIAAAQANEDKVEKGHKWYEGLTLPGKLDVRKFEFGDEKLGVVFEDEDMVSSTFS